MNKCEEDCNCKAHTRFRIRKLTYKHWHDRVHIARGKAKEQLCVQCGKQAFDWAQVNGSDGFDVDHDYRPMCRSCHLRYDDARRCPAGCDCTKHDGRSKVCAIGCTCLRHSRVTPKHSVDCTCKIHRKKVS